MSYNYAPPPPPPAQTVSPSYPHPPAQYAQHPTPPRGGAAVRSRGGRYPPNGRPEYVASYEYATQPYSPQTPLAYGSPHAPPSGYPPQQWHEHPHVPLPHAPAPISASNYHPNYAPPSAYHQPHYPQPAYTPPSQAPYAQAPYPNGPPPAPTPWHGQSGPQASYAGSRPRGSYQPEQGGSRAAAMPAPVRMGFEGETGQPQAPNGYVQSYQGRPPAPYQPQQYYSQPPPPPGISPRQDFYQSRGSRRGRGGTHRDSTRGRLPFHGVDKSRPQKKEANGPAAHSAQKTDAPAHGKKKKRKVNTLGLTPGEESASDDNEEGEEEEEDDEERLLTKLIGVEAMQITDTDAYIAERKKRYPTKERVEAKKAAELAQRSSVDQEAALLEKEADKLRRQLKKVESSIKRKREQQDEGDEMRDSSSEDEKSDDDQPEVMSSRPQNLPAPPPPPPAKKADVTKHCKYYSTGGSCGKKGKCRFVHDPAVREAALREKEENNGQMTIKQRLILNDKDQEDLTILESIQYLRDKGLMAKVPASNETMSGDGQQPEKPESPEAPSLPAPPPSLPRPPIKRESGLPAHKPPTSSHASSKKSGGTKRYLGWNLSGYGNSGVHSDDLP